MDDGGCFQSPSKVVKKELCRPAFCVLMVELVRQNPVLTPLAELHLKQTKTRSASISEIVCHQDGDWYEKRLSRSLYLF